MQEEEAQRVDKELGKIRQKFTSQKNKISDYDRKKCVHRESLMLELIDSVAQPTLCCALLSLLCKCIEMYSFCSTQLFVSSCNCSCSRRYVFKLLYAYMMGYDVDFGHMEAMNLITAQKYSEKQVGYLWATVLLNEVCTCVCLTNAIGIPLVYSILSESCHLLFRVTIGCMVTVCLQNNEFLRLVTNSIRNDIISRNETHQSLALTCVANSTCCIASSPYAAFSLM